MLGVVACTSKADCVSKQAVCLSLSDCTSCWLTKHLFLHASHNLCCCLLLLLPAGHNRSHVALTKAPFYVLSVANGSPDYDKEIMQLLAQYFPDLQYALIPTLAAAAALQRLTLPWL